MNTAICEKSASYTIQEFIKRIGFIANNEQMKRLTSIKVSPKIDNDILVERLLELARHKYLPIAFHIAGVDGSKKDLKALNKAAHASAKIAFKNKNSKKGKIATLAGNAAGALIADCNLGASAAAIIDDVHTIIQITSPHKAASFLESAIADIIQIFNN